MVYADIGPSSGEQGETSVRFQDDKIEYAEIQPLNHELAFNPLAGIEYYTMKLMQYYSTNSMILDIHHRL